MTTHKLASILVLAALTIGLGACAPRVAATVLPPTETARPAATNTALPASPTSLPPPTATQAVVAEALSPAPSASTTAPVLEPGNYVELVYHAVLGQVVLVNGGPEFGKPAGDPVELWGWDGAAWSLLSAAADGPRWRNGASVTYDGARGQLVLFGGSQGRRNMLDMWLWDGTAWIEVEGELPPYTGNTGIAYDAERERVVLFGGSDVSFNLLAETWEWDGQAWTLVTIEGPAARFPGAMTYDAGRGEVLLYGGHSPSANGDFVNWGDTWGWDGSAWHEYTPPEPLPGVRLATRIQYDGNLNEVLLFGGVPDIDPTSPMRDTWAWDGGTWTQLEVDGPSQREWHAMTYDPEREVVVLFGGFEAPPYLGTPPNVDTWEWDGEGWRCVGGCET